VPWLALAVTVVSIIVAVTKLKSSRPLVSGLGDTAP